MIFSVPEERSPWYADSSTKLTRRHCNLLRVYCAKRVGILLFTLPACKKVPGADTGSESLRDAAFSRAFIDSVLPFFPFGQERPILKAATQLIPRLRQCDHVRMLNPQNIVQWSSSGPAKPIWMLRAIPRNDSAGQEICLFICPGLRKDPRFDKLLAELAPKD